MAERAEGVPAVGAGVVGVGPGPGLVSMVPTGTTTGVEALSTVADAQKASLAAEKAKKSADEAEREARLGMLSPQAKKVMEARQDADKAVADARVASLGVLQAKANKVLERKLGRELREGEYARWISGDLNNLRTENIELCSPEILAMEQRLGRHVDAEDLVAYEEEYEAKHSKKGKDK